MNAKEQRALLHDVRDYLTKHSNNSTLVGLRSDLKGYNQFNLNIAKGFGLDIDHAFGSPCIVIDRFRFGGTTPQMGSWDGIGDYTQNLSHILKHLLPEDLDIVVSRHKVQLTPDGPISAKDCTLAPDVMMGGSAIVSGPAQIAVSMPRALLLAAIEWKLEILDAESPGT